MKQEFYDRLAAPFETSERKKNCLLRVNHILTDVVYLVYPALLFYLMVYRDSRFWRVLLVPVVTFVLVSLFRRKFNASAFRSAARRTSRRTGGKMKKPLPVITARSCSGIRHFARTPNSFS